MPRKSLRDFHVSKKLFKYPLVDKMSSLRDRKVTATLWIEFIPVFGWIHRVGLKETREDLGFKDPTGIQSSVIIMINID